MTAAEATLARLAAELRADLVVFDGLARRVQRLAEPSAAG